MAGPHDYTAGTERALFHVAKGTCYYPDCPVPLIRWLEGEPVVAVDIAHIHGAKPTSARYDPAMTDDQRRAFTNLTFLCTPHHKLVDRIRPDDYPADTLRAWKRDNEGEGADELARLAVATDSTIERLITDVIRQIGQTREVTAELRAGVIMSAADVAMTPFASHAAIRDANAHIRELPDVVVVEVRNVGNLAVEVTGVDIYWDLRLDGADEIVSMTLMARNDYPRQNPALPHRLLDGARLTWLTSGNTIREQERHAVLAELIALRAVVTLATGESIETPAIPWADVSAAGFASA